MTSQLQPEGDVQLRVAAPVAHLTLGSSSTEDFPHRIRQAGTRIPGDVRVVVVDGNWSDADASDADDLTAADLNDDRATDALTHDALIHDALTHDALTHDALTHDVEPRSRRPFDWLERADIISVAALRSPVTGAGLALALACDVRIATTDATFALPRLERGRLPAFGVLSRLVDALGYARAFELCVLGTRLSADQAVHWGLVSSTVAASDLDATVTGTVDAILALPRSATTEAKALLKAAAAGALDPDAESAAARRLARERAGYADG